MQEKWDRAKDIVQEMLVTLERSGCFNFKTLEHHRGFLVYITRTYPALTPYLKGIHLTIDSWRPHRDDDGWKVARQVQDYLGDSSPVDNSSPPLHVTAVPRLRDDLSALREFFAAREPPSRYIRGSRVVSLIYGFGDASGAGFGSSFQTADGVHYRYGIWGDDLAHYSSNYREAFNLLEGLEHQVASMNFLHFESLVYSLADALHWGELVHTEIFLFTDNAVAEGAFYKGSSPSRQLFELVLKLKCLELHHGLRLHLIHVSGTRMQAQGTDGLSRGDLTNGVMNGADMPSFVPLHLSALDRSSGVFPWILTWLPAGCNLIPLSPTDWFFKGHGLLGGEVNPEGLWVPISRPLPNTCLLWVPPPAAGNIAIE
jgi:hypothetical protein